jgi:hypothetical protein
LITTAVRRNQRKTNYRKERKVLKVKNYEPSFYLRRCRGRLGQEPGAKKILEVL